VSKLLIAPLEALVDPALTDPERRVLLALFSFRNKTADTVWPGLESIAARANIKDVTRVSKLTSALASKGWLTKKKRGFTGGNSYRLTVPDRVSNLDPAAKLEDEANLGPDTSSNLDSDTKSNLDSAAKCNEQQIEHQKEQGDFSSSKGEVFEEFWKSWPSDLGEKGSKKNAKAQWMKLSPDLHEILFQSLSAQTAHKRRAKAANEFCPPFKHVERWLRDRRWEDEVPEEHDTGEIIF
jgi:hypothetical protein